MTTVSSVNLGVTWQDTDDTWESLNIWATYTEEAIITNLT